MKLTSLTKIMAAIPTITLLVGSCCLYTGSVTARETLPDSQTGDTSARVHATESGQGKTHISADLMITHQLSDAREVDDETLFSIDLWFDHQFDNWGIFSHLEHSKTPKSLGVSSVFVDANADSSSALGLGGQGGIQLSELFIYGDITSGEWRLGLSHIAGLTSTSKVANNEIDQFMSAGLVNDLSIAVPDFALSAYFQSKQDDTPFRYRLLLSSSDGIAEQNSSSYGRLFDPWADDKGWFAAGEWLINSGAYNTGLGYWRNTGKNAVADKGVYLTVDYTDNNHGGNIRFGQADATKDNIRQFMAASYQYQWAQDWFGVGYTVSRYETADSEAINIGGGGSRFNPGSPGQADRILRQLEVYYRLRLVDGLSLTPSIQWTDSMSLPTLDKPLDGNFWIFSLRFRGHL